MDFKHHVFLSYCHKDSEIMQRVCHSLRSAGLSVWTDDGIEPGTPLWKDAIQDAIENSGCLAVILSPDAKKSSWVKRELEYAEAQEKYIFPLLARGNSNNAIPFALIGSQHTDLERDYDKNVRNLINAIYEHLNIDRLPDDFVLSLNDFSSGDAISMLQFLFNKVKTQGKVTLDDFIKLIDSLTTSKELKSRLPQLREQLISKASKQDFLSYDDILEVIPEAERDLYLLDDLMDQLAYAGIEILPMVEMKKEVDEFYYEEAVKLVQHERKATIALLQTNLRLSYSKAKLIMETLEKRGIVGPARGKGLSRKILISEE